MLNQLHTFAAIAFVALGTIAFADDEDLFSDVQTKSVFEDKTSKDSVASVAKRVTSPEALRDLLKSAGFEVKVASARAVTLEKKLEPWTFPVLMVISEDEKQLSIMLGLNSIKDVTKELPAATLLKMMEASQNNAPALFSYHAKRERTELSRIIDNQGITGLLLRDAVNKMAILAKQTSAIWSSSTANSTATPETTASTSTTGTSKPVSTVTSLAGKWSASRSATEAFAVELTSAGTFNLVYINSGKQTKSSGKFTVEEGKLSLIGSDGLKLEGKLTIKSDTQFSFSPANGKALEFAKAK